MKDNEKTQKQLIKELAKLHRRIAGLETSERQRKEEKKALRAELDKTQQYLDIAEVILVALNKKGEITLINRKGNQILGYKEGELLDKNWFTTCLPSPFRKDVKAVFTKLMAGRGKITEFYENPVLTKSGTKRIIAWHNTLLKNTQGNRVGTLSSGKDITERKQTGERLQLLSSAVEQSTDGLAVTDLTGNLLFVNTAFATMHGYTQEELVGKHFSIFHKPEQMPSVKAANRQLKESGEFSGELWRVRRDGTVFPTLMHNSLLRDEGGNTIGMIRTLSDISERKQAEEKLRESEERYKTLFDEALVGICLADAETGIIIDCNEAMAALVGRERADLIGRPQNILHPPPGDDNAALSPTFKQHLTDKEGQILETQVVTRTGEIREVEIKANLLDLQGREVLQGLFHDITERKQAEATLRESEQRYRGLFEGAAEGILIADLKSKRFLYANPSMCNMLGYSEEELRNLSVRDIHPTESLKHVISEFEAQARGEKTLTPAIPCVRKNGTILYADIVTSKILIDNKKCNVGFFTDITERKRAAEALQESEIRLRTLFEAIPDTVLVHDDKGNILHVNEIGAQRLEWSAKDLVGRNLCEIVTPENAFSIADHVRETLKAGWSRFETTYVSRSGWKIAAEVNERPIKFGKEKAILSVARDITERKQAEKALEREKNFSNAIINSSPDLLFVFSEKGNIIRWNSNAEKVTGYSASEISKMNVLEFVAEEDIATAAEGVQDALTKGQASVEINLLTKAGKKTPFYIIGLSTKIENANCVVCTGIDITERKQAEEEVKRGYEQLHETLISTVDALASTVEMKDQYTAGHQQRVTQLACAIAEEMDLPPEQIVGIRMAASIHDIGKVIIPAEILNKPGPLTELQFEMIKMHPQAGYDILKGIKFPRPVAKIILQHHELMDGSGYPQGLSGEEIMVEARILMVANVIEAMNSHRPYRPAFDMKVALEEISKNRGVLYDPEVVDACVRLFTEKKFMFM